MTFPRWKYTGDKVTIKTGDFMRPGLHGRIINSQEELDALGGIWYDTPTQVYDAQNKGAPTEDDETIDSLRRKLDKAGISYDKRIGVNKLKELLSEV